MMKDSMIKQINQLSYSTDSTLKTVQQAMIPAQFDLGAERRHGYSYSGYNYPIRTPNRMIFYCKSIPYRNLGKRKNNLVFIDNMINLITKNEIYPFMVFINGKFIKWSNISIIHDFKHSYLVVDNIDVTSYESISSILLPFTVAYNESGITYGSTYDIFKFDDEGVLSYDGTTVISYSSRYFYFKEDTSTFGFRNVELEGLDPGYKMSDLNVLCFRDGKFRPDAKVNMYDFNIFSIDNGSYVMGSSDTYKVFYYKREGNLSSSNIYRFPNPEELRNIIKRRNNGIMPPDWFEFLETPFDFKFFTTDKTHKMNVDEGLAYIMNYNPLLMSDMFKGKGDIESRRWSGIEFKHLAGTDNRITLPRTLDGKMFDNYIIVLVDGLLYKWYGDVKHINKYVSIPIKDIPDDSIVELLYFKNIDNRRYTINIRKEDTDPDITDPTIDHTKIQLFSKVPFDPSYELDQVEQAQYLVPFTIVNDNKFRLSLSYYYGKDIVVAMDNQFRYKRINVQEDDPIYVTLTEDFYYCKNEKSFLVFLNQTRLNGDEFRITIPKTTRPFDDLRIYTTPKLKAGDVLDIFYIGTPIDDIVLLPAMGTNGDIIIDKTKIAYGLDRNIYMVFVNGYKIPPEHMEDMGSNHIKIIHNYDTLKNVSIVKYIDDEDIINEYFQASTSIWDDILDMIPEMILNSLMGTETGMTDNYNRLEGRDFYTLKAILLEIIKEFWLLKGFNNGDPFVYDYDTTPFEEKEGVYVLPAMDANDPERIITD